MKYIHVVSQSKVPANRGENRSPFEEFDSDPNGDKFGPSKRSMFLVVEEPSPPTINPITQIVTPTYTPDISGKNVLGIYIGRDSVWRLTWDVGSNDIDIARDLKAIELQQDEDAVAAVGYPTGVFVFPFTEEFFRLLQARHYWLDIAITDGEATAEAEITFSDQNGKEVSANLVLLRDYYRQFGKQFLIIFEKTVRATDAMEAATTLAEIDAVTWG